MTCWMMALAGPLDSHEKKQIKKQQNLQGGPLLDKNGVITVTLYKWPYKILNHCYDPTLYKL